MVDGVLLARKVDLQALGLLGLALAVAASWRALPCPHYWSAPQHGQSDPSAAPQLGSFASSGRAWRLWAAHH